MREKTPEEILQKKRRGSPRAAYIGFLFQTFFKRPFGYIVACLYILYLAVILLIVPSVIHSNPLFIWSNPAFNMPIFNLFFISASAASLAVCIFRVGREDGTELSLCAKPLTKNTMIFGKTFVYIIIMLCFSALSIAILALVKPVFGEFDLIYNPTGITPEKYGALLLSVFIGNLVNMLFFGGISVLITMAGGQVITMIGTVGIAFIMCLLNVIYPLAINSPRDVIKDSYNTSINSYSANTLSQYYGNSAETKLKQFAAIQCIVDDDGKETRHFDTAEYWRKANREAGLSVTNYIDFGKQLSYLYSSFGLDESKLLEASKLSIGLNVSNNYKIINGTCVSSQKNVDKLEYPIAVYEMRESQGMSYPIARMLAGNMDLEKNWSLISKLFDASYDAVMLGTKSPTSLSRLIWTDTKTKDPLTKKWFTMAELRLNEKEREAAEKLFNEKLFGSEALKPENIINYSKKPHTNLAETLNYSAAEIIQSDDSGVFFEKGKFDDLSMQKKFEITNKINLYWVILASKKQINLIEAATGAKYPFTSQEIKDWYNTRVLNPETITPGPDAPAQYQIMNIIKRGIYVADYIENEAYAYTMPVTSSLEYAETLNNSYQYEVTSFYNTKALIAAWSAVSILFFSAAIVIYKKTDFK